MVPSGLRVLLAESSLGECHRLRCVDVGGEALDRELARDFQRCLPTVALGNFYGPTEVSITATHRDVHSVPDGAGTVSIGQPVFNTRCYILDAYRQLLPISVAGELYIGGVGLARGYLNRPDLTAERFVADPFRPGKRLYRTGDQARYQADGTIEYLGRLDHQVKVRGFRIELGEIESVLTTHDRIKQAVVVVREDTSGDQRIVAYLIGTPGDSFTGPPLRVWLAERLPQFMIPRAFMFMEVQLTALWRQVLGDETVGIHDNFFDLGGHSLNAVRLLSYVMKITGMHLPLATLFQAPTIAQMAQLLTRLGWTPSGRSLVTIQPSGLATPIFAVPGAGGVTAYEIAQQLRAQGEKVTLIILETWAPLVSPTRKMSLGISRGFGTRSPKCPAVVHSFPLRIRDACLSLRMSKCLPS